MQEAPVLPTPTQCTPPTATVPNSIGQICMTWNEGGSPFEDRARSAGMLSLHIFFVKMDTEY